MGTQLLTPSLADELLKEVHYSGHDYPGMASAIAHWASYLHATESLVEGLLDMSKGCFDEMEDWNNLLQARWRPVTSGSPNEVLERLLEGSWTGAPEWAGPTIRRRDPADRNSCVCGARGLETGEVPSLLCGGGSPEWAGTAYPLLRKFERRGRSKALSHEGVWDLTMTVTNQVPVAMKEFLSNQGVAEGHLVLDILPLSGSCWMSRWPTKAVLARKESTAEVLTRLLPGRGMSSEDGGTSTSRLLVAALRVRGQWAVCPKCEVADSGPDSQSGMQSLEVLIEAASTERRELKTLISEAFDKAESWVCHTEEGPIVYLISGGSATVKYMLSAFPTANYFGGPLMVIED